MRLKIEPSAYTPAETLPANLLPHLLIRPTFGRSLLKVLPLLKPAIGPVRAFC